MKILNYLTAFAAFAIVSTSCQKAEVNQNSGPRTVQIKIKQEGVTTGQNESRAIGDNVANKTKVTFTDGLLLFADDSNVVTLAVEVKNGTAAYDGKVVGKKELEEGVTISNIPGVSTKAAFIGNPDPKVKGKAKMIGTDIGTVMVLLQSQYSNGGVDKVSLYGEAPLTAETGGSTPNAFSASVNVKPIVTRFEIGKIEGKSSTGGTMTYNVRGIFMDFFHRAMFINGEQYLVNPDVQILNGGLRDHYVGNNPDWRTGYDAEMSGITHDWVATGDLPKPGANKSWAYNLLAPKQMVTPRIVIVLDNVVVNGTAMQGTYFLTLGKYSRMVNGVKTPIRYLEQGKVFALPVVSFTEKELDDEPYSTDKSVVIEIELMEWEREVLGFEFI
jgi:hypothetical protein